MSMITYVVFYGMAITIIVVKNNFLSDLDAFIVKLPLSIQVSLLITTQNRVIESFSP